MSNSESSSSITMSSSQEESEGHVDSEEELMMDLQEAAEFELTMRMSGSEIFCYCCAPATLKQSRTERNPDRLFYCCANPIGSVSTCTFLIFVLTKSLSSVVWFQKTVLKNFFASYYVTN